MTSQTNRVPESRFTRSVSRISQTVTESVSRVSETLKAIKLCSCCWCASYSASFGACVMMVGGVIWHRGHQNILDDKEVEETFTKPMRFIGPALMFIGLMLVVAGLSCCIIMRRKQNREAQRQGEQQRIRQGAPIIAGTPTFVSPTGPTGFYQSAVIQLPLDSNLQEQFVQLPPDPVFYQHSGRAVVVGPRGRQAPSGSSPSRRPAPPPPSHGGGVPCTLVLPKSQGDHPPTYNDALKEKKKTDAKEQKQKKKRKK